MTERNRSLYDIPPEEFIGGVYCGDDDHQPAQAPTELRPFDETAMLKRWDRDQELAKQAFQKYFIDPPQE